MGKAYVDVYAVHLSDGRVELKGVRYKDKVYPVDRVIRRVRAASTKAGGVGIRYTVCISGRQVSLFDEENGRWFVYIPDP